MTCIFVQIQCVPGKTYEVAEKIVSMERHSEIYSTSGEYDLIVKFYFSQDLDIGREINAIFAGIEGIQRTLTTQTFRAF